MLNQLVLVGKVISNMEIVDCNTGNNITIIKLSVIRNQKNENNTYENDIIPLQITGGLGKTAAKNCEAGSTIGIKGRIVSDGEKISIETEKITFLARKNEQTN